MWTEAGRSLLRAHAHYLALIMVSFGLTEDGRDTEFGLAEMERAASLIQAQASMLAAPAIA